MNLLLDTHIWIWSDLEPSKLSPAVSREIEKEENERFLSSVSIWELTVLLEKGRIRAISDFGEWLKRTAVDLSLSEVPVTWEVARELRFTRLAHRDPADRFLVATARVYDLTLVTADERLMNVPGVKVLANR